MDDLRLDYLPKINLKIYQSKKMFKINTFSCLLGEFLDFEEGKSVLDIGTNNGVQLIYASLLKPSKLTGIDINKEALEVAKKNLEYHNISNYELINIEAQKYASQEKFDVIISNPPFFKLNDYSKDVKNKYLLMAKHEEYLKLDDLILAVSLNLKNDGYFYLIHQHFRLKEIEEVLTKYNLYINKERIITNKNRENPTGVILKISHTPSETLVSYIEA